MKIPSKLKVGGHWVIIKHLKTLDKDEKFIGLAEISHKRIKLATHLEKKPLPESQRAETFLHEIVHYASNLCGASLRERDIKGISETLFQIIRDNGLDFRRAK